jgi:hypothetical protein
MTQATNSNTNTTTRIIVNGIIDAPVIKAIVASLHGALRPEWSSIPEALSNITFMEYTAVIEGGKLAEGRDMELASMLVRLYKSCNRRLAYALAEQERGLIAKDAFHQSEVLDTKGNVLRDNVPAVIASGMAELFDAMPVYDPEVDGMGFDNDTYRPTVDEAVYDVECVLRLMFSLSKHEGLSWLARPFEGSDGRIVNVAPTFAEWARAERARDAEILAAMALAEKNGEVYFGQQPMHELLRAGLELDVEIHPSKVGANEAFECVERLLTLVGYTTEIGKEIVEGAGYGKACNLVEALYKRNWRGAKSALRHVGLIAQSSLGVNLIKQITDSPEWEAAVFEREDAEMRRIEGKAKREFDRDNRMSAVQRDRDVRDAMRKQDEALRAKAAAEHQVFMATLAAETKQKLGQPLSKAEQKLLGVDDTK